MYYVFETMLGYFAGTDTLGNRMLGTKVFGPADKEICEIWIKENS